MGRPKRVSDEELLAVARGVFVEQGIGASTREIARRVGISEATIYQRHPTKADLFFAAMAPPALDVRALLDDAGDLAGVERLEAIAIGMVTYFRELVPILLPLMTHPSFDIEDFAARHPDSPVSTMRSGLVTHLEAEHARGAVTAEAARAGALTLFAALHSVAIFERLGAHGGAFDDDLVRAMVRTLWAGLAPRGDAST